MFVDPPHPATLDDDALRSSSDERRSRSSGPGGQHRNKVETGVTLRHRATGIEGSATERRSQLDNRRMAIKRLRLNLALEVRTACDPSHEPSERWRGRVRDRKVAINPSHADFAPMLAEVLDRAAVLHHDLSAVAMTLGVSTTQLVRFLQLEPRALAEVNAARAAANQRPYR